MNIAPQELIDAPLRPFAVLRRFPDYRRTWTANMVSDLGTWIQLTVVTTLIARQTGSALRTGLIAAATFGPQLISAPIGGLLADRYERKRILMCILGLQTIAAGILATAIASGQPTSVLTLIVLAQGIIGSAFNPVASSIIPELVPREGILAASSLGSVAWNSGRIAGPIIATLLARATSPAWCIAANALSFAILFLSYATLPRRFPPAALDVGDSLLRRAKAGVRALRATRTALFAYQMCLITQFTVAPMIGLIPIFATKVLRGDSSTVSALYASFGIGSLIGSLSTAAIVAAIGRPRTAVAMLGTGAVLLIVLAQTRSTGMAVLVSAPLGATFIGGFVTLNSVIPRDSPAAERGRIASIFSATVGATYGFGVIWMGALADASSVGTAFTVGAAAAAGLLGLSTIFFWQRWSAIGSGDPASRRAIARGLSGPTLSDAH